MDLDDKLISFDKYTHILINPKFKVHVLVLIARVGLLTGMPRSYNDVSKLTGVNREKVSMICKKYSKLLLPGNIKEVFGDEDA